MALSIATRWSSNIKDASCGALRGFYRGNPTTALQYTLDTAARERDGLETAPDLTLMHCAPRMLSGTVRASRSAKRAINTRSPAHSSTNSWKGVSWFESALLTHTTRIRISSAKWPRRKRRPRVSTRASNMKDTLGAWRSTSTPASAVTLAWLHAKRKTMAPSWEKARSCAGGRCTGSASIAITRAI